MCSAMRTAYSVFEKKKGEGRRSNERGTRRNGDGKGTDFDELIN